MRIVAVIAIVLAVLGAGTAGVLVFAMDRSEEPPGPQEVAAQFISAIEDADCQAAEQVVSAQWLVQNGRCDPSDFAALEGADFGEPTLISEVEFSASVESLVTWQDGRPDSRVQFLLLRDDERQWKVSNVTVMPQ